MSSDQLNAKNNVPVLLRLYSGIETVWFKGSRY